MPPKNLITMNAFITLWSLGGPEIILILAVVLLMFGGRKIPELMKGLGKGMKEFKDATKEGSDKPAEKE